MTPVSPVAAGSGGPGRRVAVVGAGRMGRALVAAMPHWEGPFGRGFDGGDAEVLVLAVPDGEITRAAAALRPGLLVGLTA